VHKHLLHVVSQKQNKCRKKPKVKNTTDKYNKTHSNSSCVNKAQSQNQKKEEKKRKQAKQIDIKFNQKQKKI